ncbi:hypothetical protein A3H16_01780 [Candidatus Kaiserbacteria bacterium RIFCSPLOWO2_12_FULL_53_8]|uniref:Type II secretion system protein GspG C-terminal domain-containing protein n=2 Tax=Candidatus Kaiseribacteriota TaxID=1752734 RepID=A0A1F6CWE9_9BACT|nr:MAG: hypothetical protein A2851_04185 [Candidatus Kaiserbacteria bacterium RIFCSPHIGHO2_01_FULL_53_29]OGG91857.1 MAG: hypothetical protein A3H16_01780 [Candidatus Kaiserbacteria bacterium RIFCSPLOWO2_12_FULL_53_8]
MKISYKRGFTLIELLVVIAIIGILSSIVLASLNSARKKGRDARRISDIKQMQLALELSYDAAATYPLLFNTASVVTPGYISTVPTDPSTSVAYIYQPATATGGTLGACSATPCNSYVLEATLETAGHSALASDVDGTVLTDPNVACGTQGASEVEYCATP